MPTILGSISWPGQLTRLNWFISQTLAGVAILAIASSDKILAAPSYKFPIDAFSFTFKYNHLAQLNSVLIGKHYRGDYHNNGVICHTADFSLQLQRLLLKGNTKLNLLDGTASTNINAAAKIELREDRCRLGVFNGTCTATVPLKGNLGQRIIIPSLCHINWSGTPISTDLTSESELLVPIQIPPSYLIDLPPKQTQGDLQLDLSFAHLVNNAWDSLPSPNDKQISLPIDGDAYFHSRFWATPNDPAKAETGGDNYLTISAFRQRFETTNTTDDAIRRTVFLTRELTDNPYSFASLRIKQELFAPPQFSKRGDRGTGVLGIIFPLIISGKSKLEIAGESRTISINIVLDSASSQILVSNGSPETTVKLRVDDITLKIEETGEKLLPSPISPFLQLVGPTVDRNGKLNFTYVAVGLDLETQSSTQRILIPIGDFLTQKLNTLMPDLALLNANVTLSTPDCIDVQNDRIDAYRPCNAQGGITEKLLAVDLRDGKESSSLKLDLTQTAITAYPGELIMHLYVDKTSMQQHSTRIIE